MSTNQELSSAARKAPFAAAILNPAAAGGKALGKLPKVAKALKGLMPKYDIYVTSGPGDAQEMATQYADSGASVVIAVGGDGTFNEVANGLLRAKSQVPMGIVAAGHGCDFPRTINSPRDVDEAVEIACRGRTIAIDLGLARCVDGLERHFINVAGLGFDAQIAQRAAKSRLPGAQLPYLTALAASLASLECISVSIEVDGETIETRAVFVTVANARFFGGGFLITPMADIQDGKLDLAIIGELGRAELLKEVPGVYRGKHITHPKFTHRSAMSIHIDSKEHALVQVDGEMMGPAPVTFSIKPAALQLAVS
jgi:diacylglycerol kinase (ATP)